MSGNGPQNQGFREQNEVGSNPYREGDHNRNVSDLDRTNQLADFVDWAVANNYQFSSNPDDINAILQEYSPQMVGTDPGWLEQLLVEQGDHIGQAIGTMSPVPMGGTIGKYFAQYLIDNYWQDHQWASPADQTLFPENWQDDLGIINDFSGDIEGYSPMEGGRQAGPAFGNGGGFYYNAKGDLVWCRSGTCGD